MTIPCLTFHNLTLGYGGHAAIHHLNGTVASGSLTAVVGANGSGKSTLMKAIAGILQPISGCLHKDAATTLAYLPQQSEIDRIFPASVQDLVALGLWPKRGWLGWHTRADRLAISTALESVGLQGFGKRALDTLSGGQLQRALFARVIVQDARLIILDEPFNAVDRRTVEDLMQVIRHWHEQGRTVLAVLHDDDLVRAHFPQTLLLARKVVAWGDTRDVLQPAMLGKARAFQEAWDDTAPWCGGSESAGIRDGHDHQAGHAHIHDHSPMEKAHRHV